MEKDERVKKCQTKEKPINQKCVQTFFNLFNNLHPIN